MAYKKIINGMLALGYGSKYQLLRMLGWHRTDFDNQVKSSIELYDDIHWFDFKYDGPCDKELLNLEFIPALNGLWKKYWACGSTGINWDAVGLCDDGTYILVEAKAHLPEMKNSAACGKQSLENNILRITEFIEKYKINSTAEVWIKDYYQMANRLVITDYLLTAGYKVKLLYVLFENGFEYNRDKSDSASKEEWEDEMQRELIAMGIKGTSAESLINWCIIDCNPK
jgi:hypothetical protein